MCAEDGPESICLWTCEPSDVLMHMPFPPPHAAPHATTHDMRAAHGLWPPRLPAGGAVGPSARAAGAPPAGFAGWVGLLRTPCRAAAAQGRAPYDTAAPADSCRQCGVTMRHRAQAACRALCPVPVLPEHPDVSAALAAVWCHLYTWRAAAGVGAAPAPPEPPTGPRSPTDVARLRLAPAARALSAAVCPRRPCCLGATRHGGLKGPWASTRRDPRQMPVWADPCAPPRQPPAGTSLCGPVVSAGGGHHARAAATGRRLQR